MDQMSVEVAVAVDVDVDVDCWRKGDAEGVSE
jgi:hypothetical protein